MQWLLLHLQIRHAARVLHKLQGASTSGYDSPGKNPQGCLNPPKVGKGLPGPPANLRPSKYFVHVCWGRPCQIGRWAWGDPPIFRALSHPANMHHQQRRRELGVLEMSLCCISPDMEALTADAHAILTSACCPVAQQRTDSLKRLQLSVCLFPCAFDSSSDLGHCRADLCAACTCRVVSGAEAAATTCSQI